MSCSVEALAPTSIYSNVLSQLVLASFAPSPVLPRKEPLLSSPSSAVAPIDLALMPGPKELALILPVFPSPTYSLAVLTPSSPVNGTFFYFPF